MNKVESRAEISWCMRIPHATSKQIALAINQGAGLPKPFEVKGTFWIGEDTNKHWKGIAVRHSIRQLTADATIKVNCMHLWRREGNLPAGRTDYYVITADSRVEPKHLAKVKQLTNDAYERSFGNRIRRLVTNFIIC